MSETYVNAASTVDLIVPYRGGIILIKRKHEPYQGAWALPGGFLNCGKESLEEAAVRELREETSLLAKIDDLHLIGVYSEPTRDPRGHVISHAYEVRTFSGKLQANDDAELVLVYRNIPEKLAFDHLKILDDYFKIRRLEGRK